MLQEVLLIFSCTNGSGCTETYQYYKLYNPTLVESIERTVQRETDKLPVFLRSYLFPFVSVASGGSGAITVHRNTVLTIKKEELTLTYTIPLN